MLIFPNQIKRMNSAWIDSVEVKMTSFKMEGLGIQFRQGSPHKDTAK